ncbi:oxidoreductase-like domain-containing protein [Paraburkholderia sp. C35]|uniref:oxidoreductase-like domain-containing protein n=1 Tax=Paraburkholderia sp. C35 TaxID=2126993 RepID=UPI000D69CEAB|nr:oxidoreductase-like domain-containing protein [Paraburkholderia sp. C35]
MTADEATRPNAPVDGDPRPIAPTPPEPGDCCQSGCDPCVFDMYTDELTRYREELAAWEARHAQPAGHDGEHAPRSQP